MVKVSAPGKVCLAGEWAVLETGNPLIVASVNRRIFAETKKSKDDFIYISIKDFGIKKLKASIKNNKLVFEKEISKEEKQDILFVKSAIEAIINYLDKVEPFEITVWGEKVTTKINDKVVSVGIGASAASTVAVVSSLLKFHGKDIKRKDSKGKIYKLAAISHYLAQEKIGSGFGIASSTFGGIITYKRFDPSWLVEQIEKNRSFSEIVGMRWPELYIDSLYIPKRFKLLVGWTGNASSTPKMVRQMYQWKENNKREYKKLMNKIADITEELIEAWQKEDKEKIILALKKNRTYLKELGEKSEVNIETKKLKVLSDIVNHEGGVGKLSGAGGGDCGIGIIFNNSSEKIIEKWKKNKITPLNVQLSQDGVRGEF